MPFLRVGLDLVSGLSGLLRRGQREGQLGGQSLLCTCDCVLASLWRLRELPGVLRLLPSRIS